MLQTFKQVISDTGSFLHDIGISITYLLNNNMPSVIPWAWFGEGIVYTDLTVPCEVERLPVVDHQLEIYGIHAFSVTDIWDLWKIYLWLVLLVPICTLSESSVVVCVQLMLDPLTILALFLVVVGWLGFLLDGECFTRLVDLTGTTLISQASGFRILNY